MALTRRREMERAPVRVEASMLARNCSPLCEAVEARRQRPLSFSRRPDPTQLPLSPIESLTSDAAPGSRSQSPPLRKDCASWGKSSRPLTSEMESPYGPYGVHIPKSHAEKEASAKSRSPAWQLRYGTHAPAVD